MQLFFIHTNEILKMFCLVYTSHTSSFTQLLTKITVISGCGLVLVLFCFFCFCFFSFLGVWFPTGEGEGGVLGDKEKFSLGKHRLKNRFFQSQRVLRATKQTISMALKISSYEKRSYSLVLSHWIWLNSSVYTGFTRWLPKQNLVFFHLIKFLAYCQRFELR